MSFSKNWSIPRILFLCLPLLPCPISPAQEVKDSSQVLSVSGTGVVQVEPDLAYVRLGVQVRRPTAQEAQRGNAEIMAQVLQSLEKAGLPREKLKTAVFALFPEEEFGPKGVRTGKLTYQATNTVVATIDKLDEVGKIIDAGLAAGATNVEGVEFTLKNESKFQQEAYQKAVADARKKADAIATAAGLQIKSIRSISEPEGPGPPVQPLNRRVMAMEASAGVAPTPIISGKIEVRASVRIDFTY
jgi:uncharacterized protein YggE